MKGHTLRRSFLLALVVLAALASVLGVIYLDPGKGKTQTVTTVEACAAANAGIPKFDDSNPAAYYSTANPQNSVKVAGHGVTATVTGQSGTVLTVEVTNPPAA